MKRIDLTETSFYESLTGGKNISTSQPSPGDLMDLWDDIFEQGYDEIIHIPMSSGLSASCSSAISLSADYVSQRYRLQTIQDLCQQRESILHAKACRPVKSIKALPPDQTSSGYIALRKSSISGKRRTFSATFPLSVLNIKDIDLVANRGVCRPVDLNAKQGVIKRRGPFLQS